MKYRSWLVIWVIGVLWGMGAPNLWAAVGDPCDAFTVCGECQLCSAGFCVATPGSLCQFPTQANCDDRDSSCRDFTNGLVFYQCDAAAVCQPYGGCTTFTDALAGTNGNPPCPGTTDCDWKDNLPCTDYHDVSDVCDGSGSCGAGSCTSVTYTTVSCGSLDCDPNDVQCRNYDDVTKFCDGAGSCSSGSCNVYNDLNGSCGAGGPCNKCGGGSCNALTGTDCATCITGEHCVADNCCGIGCKVKCDSTTETLQCAAGVCPPCPQQIFDKDTDGDGWQPAPCKDCNDSNPLVYEHSGAKPNTNKMCDCNDGTGYGNPFVHESATTSWEGPPDKEAANCIFGNVFKFLPGCFCTNGLDDDCDGAVDSADSQCPANAKDIVVTSGQNVTITKSTGACSLKIENGGRLTIATNVLLSIDFVSTATGNKGTMKIENGGTLDLVAEDPLVVGDTPGQIKFEEVFGCP